MTAALSLFDFPQPAPRVVKPDVVILRPYQAEAVEATLAAIRGDDGDPARAILIVLPTGCVAGDTMIGVNRAGKGYSRSIERLVAAENDPRRVRSIDTYVRAMVGDRIGLHRSRRIFCSGVKWTWQLVLSNGKRLRATPDHEIMTANGFVSLGNLRESDRVICERDASTVRPRKLPRQHYRVVQGLRAHPYAGHAESRSRCGRNAEGRLYRVGLHRLVAEAGINGVSVDWLIARCRAGRIDGLHFLDPAVWAVHHKDGDALNNDPSNLQVLTHSEHHRLHGLAEKLDNLGRGFLCEAKVVRAEPYAEEPTYDITCDDPHRNFVANGIVVHNCGKTVVFCRLIEELIADGGRGKIVAHRKELIKQAAAKWREASGKPCAIEMGDRWSDEETPAPVVITSIQTQIASDGRRMKRFFANDFRVVVIDEAHHAVARSYRKLIERYRAENPDVVILGVTATPDRGDKKALGRIFEHVAYDYEIIQAIRDGWLVDIKQSVTDAEVDLSSVREVAGELHQGDLEQSMTADPALYGVVRPTMALAGDRKTLVFAVRKHHAESMAEIFRSYRVGCAYAVTESTPDNERERLFADYARGKFQFLVNVMVATEGYDDPGVQVVAIARPTKSRALYAQMVGRGTRPLAGLVDRYPTAAERVAAIAASGKPFCEVLDFVGNAGRHKLVSVADILGGKYTDEEREHVRKKLKKREGGGSVLEMLDQVREEMLKRQREREERLKTIRPIVHFKVRSVDPFDAFAIRKVPTSRWKDDRALRPRQLEILRRNKVDFSKMSYTQQLQLVNEIMRRHRQGQASLRQIQILGAAGIDARKMSFTEAGNAIDQLRGAWR